MPIETRIASAPGDTTYLESELDSTAVPVRGAGAVRYPEAMQKARQGGEVLAQFVVDERGQARMESFTVLRSSHQAFSDAVREGVATMRFKPAMLRGRAVRQLLMQPFRFEPLPSPPPAFN